MADEVAQTLAWLDAAELGDDPFAVEAGRGRALVQIRVVPLPFPRRPRVLGEQ